MTVMQWAIVATIHIEPRYRFVGGERIAAERMVARGWLSKRPRQRYAVTTKGEAVYQSVQCSSSCERYIAQEMQEMQEMP